MKKKKVKTAAKKVLVNKNAKRKSAVKIPDLKPYPEEYLYDDEYEYSVDDGGYIPRQRQGDDTIDTEEDTYQHKRL